MEAGAVKDWLWAFAQQSLDYAILLVSLDKRVLWASPGAAWILAATSSEITSGPITRFFTENDVAFGIPELERQTALRQGSSSDDRWMLRADGSPFWATGRTVAVANRDGTPLGYVKIFRDMTDLQMRVAALDNRATAGAFGRQEAPTSAGDGGLKVESLLLSEELQAAMAAAQQQQPRGNRRLELLLPPGLPLTFEGDRMRLQQVFATLIANALRFTADDGHVWINGTVEDEQVVVRVEDNGVGIGNEALQAIFALFTRAPEARAGVDDGLARVQALVELHGGSVQARSPGPGKGSEFAVRLPMRQAARASTAG